MPDGLVRKRMRQHGQPASAENDAGRAGPGRWGGVNVSNRILDDRLAVILNPPGAVPGIPWEFW